MRALLVDGYNLVYAHPGLSSMMKKDQDSAREGLLKELSPLASPDRYDLVMVVFDAAMSGNLEPVVEDRAGIMVVFTRRSQSADSFIESAVRHLVREMDVAVATSDRVLFNLVSGFGAHGISGESLLGTAREALAETREELKRMAGYGRNPLEENVSDEVRNLLDRMRYE
jgi:predicted RNA-binding protein with PIN domain